MDITRLCIYHKFYIFILIFIINYIFPTIEKIRTSCNIKKFEKKPMYLVHVDSTIRSPPPLVVLCGLFVNPPPPLAVHMV